MPSHLAAAHDALSHRSGEFLRAQDIGRVDVSEPASISASIAARYGVAIFDLAKENKNLNVLADDLTALEGVLADSADFGALIHSPIYTRAQQGDAIAALAAKMGLSPMITNALRLMASKRRLFVLPQLLDVLRALIADEKGEVTAEVTAAIALTKAQQDKLAKSLKATIGKDVKIKLAIDESLIGGMVVKVGSRMIDTSIAAKLSNLQNAMKEVR